MIKPGGNLTRKYKAAPRERGRGRDVPQERLYQEIQRGVEFFWAKRGGRPTTGTFGDTFNIGKQKTA